jgi:hypothetical protein
MNVIALNDGRERMRKKRNVLISAWGIYIYKGDGAARWSLPTLLHLHSTWKGWYVKMANLVFQKWQLKSHQSPPTVCIRVVCVCNIISPFCARNVARAGWLGFHIFLHVSIFLDFSLSFFSFNNVRVILPTDTMPSPTLLSGCFCYIYDTKSTTWVICLMYSKHKLFRYRMVSELCKKWNKT